MALPFLDVTRGAFSLEDPWSLSNTPSAALHNALTGGSTSLATSVAATCSSERLYILFSGQDHRAFRASYNERDEPLYEEDVVEIFIAPAGLENYVEIEVSPIGTLFDARVHSPNGNRQNMTVEALWDCHELWTALRRSGTGDLVRFDTLVSIPFEGLGVSPPSPGDTWRANFFRIDRHPAGDEYSAWSPTLRNPADFHVPAAFGIIRFQ